MPYEWERDVTQAAAQPFQVAAALCRSWARNLRLRPTASKLASLSSHCMVAKEGPVKVPKSAAVTPLLNPKGVTCLTLVPRLLPLLTVLILLLQEQAGLCVPAVPLSFLKCSSLDTVFQVSTEKPLSLTTPPHPFFLRSSLHLL